jgi:serine/threonine protein kinase
MFATLEVSICDSSKGRSLGSGANGQAFLGTHNATGREFVLKFIDTHEDRQQTWFKREVAVMRQMTHACTLPLLGFKPPTAADPYAVIVTDHMSNGPLSDLNAELYRGCPPAGWNSTAISKAAIGMAAGMCFGHSLDLLHGDMKPAKILMDSNYEIRIADFGRPSETRDKADVYSYAVCLYLLFQDDGGGFVRTQSIPDFYWGLMEACWKHDPDSRPSFGQILHTLKNDQGWVLPDSDLSAVVNYEAKVLHSLTIVDPQSGRAIESAAKRVDRSAYEQGHSIGQGSYGEVYQGIEKETERVVVLKTVYLDNGELQRSFMREVNVMHQMRHPATLSLIGWAPAEDDNPYGLIVMDLMENGSLDEVNKRTYVGAPYPWWDATAQSKAVIGLIAGMAYIHSMGVVHRDLKPANVFIDENYEVRIADFGRARKVDLDMTAAPGTALTQAPETYEDGGYTNKIDVYSFGVTLYLLWSDANKLDDRVDRQRPPINKWIERICRGARFVQPPGIPDFYWEIIKTCWDQGPERRPSFAALLQLFARNRSWVLPGTDLQELAEYEQKVRAGIALPLDENDFDLPPQPVVQPASQPASQPVVQPVVQSDKHGAATNQETPAQQTVTSKKEDKQTTGIGSNPVDEEPAKGGCCLLL